MSVRLLLNTQLCSHCMNHARRDVLFWVKSTKGSAASQEGKEEQHGTGALTDDGVERPCSVGIRSERVEAGGAKGVYDLDACGRLGRRDEQAWEALRYISRSLVSAPAVHHRASRWRRAFRRVGYVQRAWQHLQWREPRKRQTRLGQDRTSVDPFDVTVCQSGCF